MKKFDEFLNDWLRNFFQLSKLDSNPKVKIIQINNYKLEKIP